MTLEINQVSKKFGTKVAVSELSMTMKAGEIMGLIGQNGAGKTTTFRMILDFIQPDSGQITWNGRLIGPTMQKRIGFLPEERGLYQKWTVEEQILYFAELHGMKRADVRVQLQNWMQRLEVVGKVTDKVQSLSKGNAQKIQFIATLIHEPEFLILDEPFTGLDPVNTQVLMSEIKQLKRKGAAIIFSSHNMSGVEALSDNLTMLKQGKPILQGGVQTIRDSFGKTEIYVETNENLNDIEGVLKIEPQGAGWLITVTDEAVGRTIFTRVSQSGYVQAFLQAPPTLDEIFRQEATL